MHAYSPGSRSMLWIFCFQMGFAQSFPPLQRVRPPYGQAVGFVTLHADSYNPQISRA